MYQKKLQGINKKKKVIHNSEDVSRSKEKRKNKINGNQTIKTKIHKQPVTDNMEPKNRQKKDFKRKKLNKHASASKNLPNFNNIIKKTVLESCDIQDELDSKSDNPELDAVQLFKWIIDPVPLETFFESHWEKSALHIKRHNKEYYLNVFNSTILDKIIKNNNLHYTRNVDVVCYENGVKEIYNQEGRATSCALWDYYNNGCSIRILNPHTYAPKVHLLLATLQEYFGSMVGANIYLTPPGSQGFAPHYDDIEAFVIQLEGRKHWKLYQPKNSDILARFSSPNLKHENIGEPFMELTLNAGEVLYFPRGTIHEGHTDENSHSLHITVSVYQQTCFADLLQHLLPAALKKAAENDIEFRKGLPLNFLKYFGLTANSQMHKLRNPLHQKVMTLIQALIKYMDIDAAVDLLGKKFIYDSMPPVISKREMERTSKVGGTCMKDGKVMNRVNLELSTKIRLLRYYCIRLVQEDNVLKLYYNTENATVYHGEEEQWLELDASMIPCIKLLQNSYPSYIDIAKLPLADKEVKMQLITDLWEHGLIVTEHILDSTDNE